ncbi:DUF2530 domain-containing protein [Aestuariimicrobium kwangyangense]|uniref:DUF2530 domain-containing protein n=1 Tax=Aestuariimicrobium kwangyangense TaxID=396389 RepID=UPI0012F9B37B|nr:DUF2530 domain-containing protein [Aestuariimicrobium kwangyangense]
MSNSSAPPNSEVPTARQRPRGLLQAPIEPVDDSGVGAFRAGTLAFAVATVVLFALRNRMDEDGRGWWLGVALAGTVIGLVGLWWTRRRARRLALDQSNRD